MAVIERDGKLLLQRRFKTGWRDGFYSLVGGNAEGNESLREALSRELKEEIGIETDIGDLEFLHLLHISPKVAGVDFFYNFFKVKNYKGVPRLCEPDKSDALDWFSGDSLPANIVPNIKTSLEKIKKGEIYSEYGWESSETDLA